MDDYEVIGRNRMTGKMKVKTFRSLEAARRFVEKQTMPEWTWQIAKPDGTTE